MTERDRDAVPGAGRTAAPALATALRGALTAPSAGSASAVGVAVAELEEIAGADPHRDALRLAAGLVEVIALLYAQEPGFDDAARQLIGRCRRAGRLTWAAAARAVWALGMVNTGREDEALTQIAIAELDLRDGRLVEADLDPPGGPTGSGAAGNNLGAVLESLRLFELAEPQFVAAAEESARTYGPDLAEQVSVDRANLAENDLRWAFHASTLERPREQTQRAASALRHTRRLLDLPGTRRWPEMQAFAQLLDIGARSLLSSPQVTDDGRATVERLLSGGMLGGTMHRQVALAVQARLCRLAGDGDGAQAAARDAGRLAGAQDPTMLAAAWREAALAAAEPTGAQRDYVRLLLAQLEEGRRRSLSALRTRLAATALERRNAQLTADQRRMQRRLDDAQREEAALVHAATHDALTGLPNRALVEQRLRAALDHAADRHQPMAVAFIDLDDFKAINDGYGHDAGDRVLRWVADRLTATVTAGDTVARYAGDEFVAVLLDATDDGRLRAWAERVNDELGDLDARMVLPVAVTASVGVAVIAPGTADVAEALALADRAMYRAKRAGKATVVVEAP